MFETIKEVFRVLPAASRLAGDLERGHTPNDHDLRILNLPLDTHF